MRNARHRSDARGKSGFTLIEILVSITVLGLMMVGVAQLLNGALAASSGTKRLDADTQARMVLDRMALDISKITRRPDVDYYFAKNSNSATPGNDQMAFFSESGGYYPSGATATQSSDVALIGYRMNASNQLERLSKGLVWSGVSSTGSPMVYGAPLPAMPYSQAGWPGTLIGSTWAQVEGAGTDPDYQVIGDQIFRMEYCFLVTKPSYSSLYTTQPSVTSAYLTDVPYASPNVKPNGLQDVAAIVISIAVLDTKSQILAKSVKPLAMTTAALDLDDVAAPTAGGAIAAASLPLTTWRADLTATQLGLPKAAATQVRFYQRYCYLNRAL